MRVVLDSNIYISALILPGSSAEKAILKILDRDDTLILSREIIAEILSVLSSKFSREKEELSRVAVTLSEIGELVASQQRLRVFTDDADNRILECAVSGNANAIVRQVSAYPARRKR